MTIDEFDGTFKDGDLIKSSEFNEDISNFDEDLIGAVKITKKEIGESRFWSEFSGYGQFHIEKSKNWELAKWKPKMGGTYWYIDTWGGVIPAEFLGTSYDEARYTFGNCLKTKEQAEQAAKQFGELLKNINYK